MSTTGPDTTGSQPQVAGTMNVMSDTHGAVANFTLDKTTAEAAADTKVMIGPPAATWIGKLVEQLTSGTTSDDKSAIDGCVSQTFG